MDLFFFFLPLLLVAIAYLRSADLDEVTETSMRYGAPQAEPCPCFAGR